MPLAVKRSRTLVAFAIVFLHRGVLISPLLLVDHIDDDLDFYYNEFTTFPSIEATIEYNITYNYTAALSQCSLCYPRLEIYTTKYDTNLDRNCSVDAFGQLRNENLHTPLKLRNKKYRFTKCAKDANFTQNGIVHCNGKTKILDYIPRNYGFSFGYRCEQFEQQLNMTLRGLSYQMTIYDQTNRTQCYSMDPVREESTTEMCAGMYSHMSLPNLIGSPNWKYILENEVRGAKMFEALIHLSPHLLGNLEKCYPYFFELLCYVFVPKCDPVEKRVIHPCKEMCEHLREGCQESAIAALKILAQQKQKISNWTLVLERGPSTWFDCDYLPSENGTVPCIYKPVICKYPPNITNGIISGRNETHQAQSTVNYSCESDEFRMEGNNTVTCKYSGEWSELPRCVKKTVTPLLIVLPLLIFPFFVFATIIIMVRCVWLGKRQLCRNKEFDAFVCYNFDTDQEYVTDIILPELEENHDPAFKLCFHNRDFKPGIHIKENINKAVRNSNSAIIVLSQGFVDSIWCKEEFSDCYIENMKDPAFRLLVILMQPVENLQNISEYMISFFEKKTYLLKDDPKLFQKIGHYLEFVKNPKRMKDNEEEKEGDPEIDQLL